MRNKILDWFGLGDAGQSFAGHGHNHDTEDGGHGHTHGVIDATIATTSRGIWAIKWSFVILAVTAAIQIVIVMISGSVALLADTIHNIGDAVTAIPLWVAFMLVRRKPSRTFTYGLGRVEDLAGILIVLIILFSAVVAGYEAISRLIHPQEIHFIGWVALAGVIGFIGNEVVAVFRIKVGREINSAALIADGYHARTDGFTSLAVVLGAFGVWLGFPLADPIIGLLITVAIFGIVWQSARSVLTRMLDGVDPGVLDEIEHAVAHVKGIAGVHSVQARWLGHKLYAELSVALDPALTVAAAQTTIAALKNALFTQLPVLAHVSVQLADPDGATGTAAHSPGHHAPEPFVLACALADGLLEIADTPEGERMRLTVSRHAEGLTAVVVIDRAAGPETLFLIASPTDHHRFQSAEAPAEPHEFSARVVLTAGGQSLELPFRMFEPEDHSHQAVSSVRRSAE